ncbi:hypothetical protein CAEBREN_29149 [Caenorhabditis brenneri]|uniref:Uncharacterized protein n=1 Tax=Caenorhabditis brenneri TaxID=135651 RepID=G0MCX5_CAEBE|nr:hypothetical protein CAEBREN_29149 [Caenorhabditis brenneri]
MTTPAAMSPPPMGSNNSQNQMVTSPSQGPMYHQNQMGAPIVMSPLTAPLAVTSPHTGPNNIQNQILAPSTVAPPVMNMTTSSSQGPMYHQKQMATPPTIAMTPTTMAPPVMTMTTPPSQWPTNFQNQMTTSSVMTPYSMTPPTMAIPPSIFPPPMAPSTMTPPSMGPYNFQNPMTNSSTMTPQNMAPLSIAIPPAHNYTMNQNWNPYQTWNMHQMTGGAPMAPQQQWMVMNAQFGQPGSMPQNNGTDMSFLHGSTAADFDFRF